MAPPHLFAGGPFRSGPWPVAVWITGLPGSGKSTYADELTRLHPDFVLLRMDALRKVVTPEPTYSEAERDILYRAIVFMAKTLTEAGHDVIIDATGNLRKWRELARGLMPGYLEVYLRCPLQTCMEREKLRLQRREAPVDIYEKAKEGWPVPGLTAPYEEPINPKVTVDTSVTPVAEGLKKIEEAIEKKSQEF